MYSCYNVALFPVIRQTPFIEWLWSRMHSGGVNASAISLSPCECHPSGPDDLLGFSFFILILLIPSLQTIPPS